MKISDILSEPLVVSQLQAGNKEAALQEMAAHLCAHAPVPLPREQDVLAALLARESLGSTGVGEGVAIPHAKTAGLTQLLACFGRHRDGLPFGAVDLQPVRLVFMLLVPENSAGAHLKALARVSRLLKAPAFRATLLAADDAASLFAAIVTEDARH